MKRKLQTGQAMVELLIGILAMIAILVCIITFGEGGFHWLSSMNEAAGTAWAQAVLPNSGTLAQSTPVQPFIRDWSNTSGSSQRMQELGLDSLNYNFQDTQLSGSRSAFNATAQQTLSRSIAGNPNYIDYLNYTQPYLRSQPVFAQALGQSGTGGWLIGQSSHRFALGQIARNGVVTVDFGSGLQSLVYKRDSINLQSQVFLPPLSGLQ